MQFLKFLKESQEQYRIFQDLDGVLTDFDSAFKNLEGSEGLLPLKFIDKYSKTKFWKLINKEGEDYWKNLHWMSDGKSLWNYVKKYNPDILTKGSFNPGSKTGKLKWARNNLGLSKDRTKVVLNGGDKSSFIKTKENRELTKYDILIDDQEKNITSWVKNGGTGIFHINTNKTIKELKRLNL